jgi:hypothetical protein
MASYLDNKHSPTVKSLEKLNFVVSPEDKTNTQFGNAVKGLLGVPASLIVRPGFSASYWKNCFQDH